MMTSLRHIIILTFLFAPEVRKSNTNHIHFYKFVLTFKVPPGKRRKGQYTVFSSLYLKLNIGKGDDILQSQILHSREDQQFPQVCIAQAYMSSLNVKWQNMAHTWIHHYGPLLSKIGCTGIVIHSIPLYNNLHILSIGD